MLNIYNLKGGETEMAKSIHVKCNEWITSGEYKNEQTMRRNAINDLNALKRLKCNTYNEST